MPAKDAGVSAAIRALRDNGEAFAVCTIVRPQTQAGYRMVVHPERGVVALGAGQPGAPPPGDGLLGEVQRLVAASQSQTVTVNGRDIFIDVWTPQAQLVIVGAVHIAVALCEMASLAGFAVTVVDPRPTLNNAERFPRAKALRVGWPEDELPRLRLDAATSIAVLTHDEKFDDPSLLLALRSGVRYVGAIGSKKTQTLRRERLSAAGISTEQLARLHGPIGLDIGAQTPEEIAVAVLSEMIAVKHQRAGARLRDRSESRIHI